MRIPENKLSPNALTVLSHRYLKKDEHGNVVESPEEMFRRVANNIAQADLLYDGHAGPAQNRRANFTASFRASSFSRILRP